MADPTYPLYPVFALIGFVLALIPLPWHFQAWNSGTCLFMIWTALGCLNFFINSIIWHNNLIDWAPIWCDISTRLSVGAFVAIPASSLCINRRLYKIASGTNASITRAQKRRAVLIDLLIGLGIPALQMPLQFVVQGHRYDIWEDVGCYPTTVNTPLAYPLSFLWPNVIGLISAVYSILTLRAFLRRRADFGQILSCSTALSSNQYIRLMLLATLEIVINVPISSYDLYLNATKAPIYPWHGWSDLHFDWYQINTYPAFIWRMDSSMVATLELTRWSPIICAFIFFSFFGFAQEARKNYRLVLSSVTKRLNSAFSRPQRDESFSSFKSLMMRTNSLPVCAPKSTTRRSVTSNRYDTMTLIPRSSCSSTWKLDITPTSSSSSPFTA